LACVGPQRHRKKKLSYLISGSSSFDSRSQWPRGLRCRSAAARPLRFGFESQWTWMSVCRECCVSSGRGLCVGLITCPQKSSRLWCAVVCDLEISLMRRRWPTGGGGLLRQKQINKARIKLKMVFKKINNRLKRINNETNFTRQ